MPTFWNVCSLQDVKCPVPIPRSRNGDFCWFLGPQRKPCIHSILSPCEENLAYLAFRFYSLPIYPTTQCKLPHVHHSLTEPRNGHPSWYQEEMLLTWMLGCAATFIHLLLELSVQSSRTVFFAMWKGYRLHKIILPKALPALNSLVHQNGAALK